MCITTRQDPLHDHDQDNMKIDVPLAEKVEHWNEEQTPITTEAMCLRQTGP